ncbi:hypothetical protein [Phocoenobacter skyensis]|uniref:Lipoprotein n=1 Tax=Phocoenobacter skyensis TaxID=97481 RepID=A0AAJ6NEL4_9PAST|nr:hypothetical protein [Pasteurella skyensis]MDP8175370.1 hypothetical protein [Pasteurella skyensis]
MKKLLVVSLLSIFLTACTSPYQIVKEMDKIEAAKELEYKKNKLDEVKKDQSVIDQKCEIFEDFRIKGLKTDGKYRVIKSTILNRPLFKDGKIVCSIFNTEGTNKVLVGENGIIDGLKYHVSYIDGGAKIGDDAWKGIREYKNREKLKNVLCNEDKITDKKTCRIYFGEDLEFVKTKGKFYLYVGKNHFPGRKSYIRLNKNRAITTGNNGFLSKNARKLYLSIKNDDSLVVAYTEWPYDNEKQSEIDTDRIETVRMIFEKISDEYLK